MKNILESGPAASVEAAREEPAAGTEEQREQPDFQSFESIEKMQESEEILSRCVSEISGVEILKGKNGGIYLVSEKKRILPRHTLVGGYGAGKFLGLFYCFMSFQAISVTLDLLQNNRCMSILISTCHCQVPSL